MQDVNLIQLVTSLHDSLMLLLDLAVQVGQHLPNEHTICLAGALYVIKEKVETHEIFL